ncbi:hypothetical protein P7K49_038170, partial [Saguinus oedipus]
RHVGPAAFTVPIGFPRIRNGLSGVGAGQGLVSGRGSPTELGLVPCSPSPFPPVRVSSQPVLSSPGQ